MDLAKLFPLQTVEHNRLSLAMIHQSSGFGQLRPNTSARSNGQDSNILQKQARTFLSQAQPGSLWSVWAKTPHQAGDPSSMLGLCAHRMQQITKLALRSLQLESQQPSWGILALNSKAFLVTVAWLGCSLGPERDLSTPAS